MQLSHISSRKSRARVDGSQIAWSRDLVYASNILKRLRFRLRSLRELDVNEIHCRLHLRHTTEPSSLTRHCGLTEDVRLITASNILHNM